MVLMPTSRSYRDACTIARALDVVGERWALLIVRELLFGPQRFSVLRKALPGVSSNLLTDRLRELETREVLLRRPGGDYELTAWGRGLEPILLALGDWGSRVARPPEPTLTATSVLIFLRGTARADVSGTYRIELGERVWTVRADGSQVHVESGEPARADASVRTDPWTLNDILTDPAAFDVALADGRLTVSGKVWAFRRLVRPR